MTGVQTCALPICGAAITAGLPENKMPLIVFDPSENSPVKNNADLVLEGVSSMKEILGEGNVRQVNPSTVAEDFGKYGITEENIPIALFWLGGVNQQKYDDFLKNGTFLPPLHNSAFAPDFTPTFKGGVAAMTKTMIDLFNQQ